MIGSFAHWPKLGLGCAKIGSFSNPASLRQSSAFLETAARAGITLFDTADIYGQGDSERAIGRAARRLDSSPLIVTKGGRRFSSKARMLLPFKPLLRPLMSRRGATNAVTARREANERCDWSAGYLAAALPASLRRLGQPCVEAFVLHSPPVDIIVDPAVVAVMASFLESGVARHVGVSCDDMESLDAALQVPIYTVVELDWPVIEAARNGPQGEALLARGIAVIARGALTHQPHRDPLDVFQSALADPLITTTLIGTQQPARLQAIAERFAPVITQGRS